MGNIICGFEIIKEIARGGLSVCYLAKQKSLDREVILKVLHHSISKNEEMIKRFHREARILSKLNHPSIVKVIDFGKMDDSYFICLEYIKGETLRQRIKRGRIPLNEARKILIDILSALSYIHSRGIVHRDIKPENIILTEERAVLTDFGLAVSKEALRITSEDTLPGTPAYLPFEVLQGRDYTPSSDIYSLGICALEMITGKPPYSGKTFTEILKKILTEKPEGIKELQEQTPEDFANVILKMIEKEPEKRYKSADEVLRDLKVELPKKKVKRLSWFYIIPVLLAFLILFLKEQKGKGKIAEEKITKETIIKVDTVRKVEIIRERIKIYEIEVECKPKCDIYLNEKLIAKNTNYCRLGLKEGKYTLKFKNPAFPEIAKIVEINGNKKIAVNLFNEVSYLFLNVKPWAEVFIDGEYITQTPIAEAIKIKPGKHKVRLQNPYFEPWEKEINFKAGDTVRIKVKLK